ncbi:hypothetical protein ISF_00760 [Cordyceps fumosorosea ARSEF 2679]|uniref:Uncharacterized protein n=1 Tax=Cordyceps fumosorosea (strain ARSEF 2679) TaxID=1081104 RepID=A0A162N159_CORFA|nr:hypothetical protein ISF_00760 [Cordyceps fumosorosea ARSEF 2679]OAA73859.1 hypothetical protein ISF_00760 [Cordyceps fumosorosea ARSEF 2679]
MSSSSVDVDAASRISSSTARNTATANPAMAQRRPDAVQLSAADCSIGDDTGAVTSSSFGLAATSETEQLPPPPPFEPLFALLTNTTTGATVHPRVHYLFSDDDASIPTADDDDPAADNNDPDAADRHRNLVVDLTPTPARDAWTVSCASSLGPAFAITAAALSKQQAEGGNGSAEPSPSSSGGAALMLHVEGVSRDPVDLRASAEGGASLRSSSGSGGAGPREDLDGLADDFRRRMGVLKKVVGEGEKRRRVAAAAAAQQEHELEHDGAGSNEIHDPGALRSETASQSHGGAALNTS